MGAILLVSVCTSLLLSVGIALLAVLVGALVIYFGLRLALTIPALVLEGLRPGAAFGRSWNLMRGNVFRLVLLALLASPTLLWVFAVGAAVRGLEISDREARLAVDAVAASAQGILVAPTIALWTAVSTIFYLEVSAPDERSPA
jgi:hypothetical protein